jgi:sialate O-acetylesterase
MEINGTEIIISFTDVGSGLIVGGGGELNFFSIAGDDKEFIWAKANIQGNTVVVWNGSVGQLLAVRYAWSDNPDGATLYNFEGLPASPFRTDE